MIKKKGGRGQAVRHSTKIQIIKIREPDCKNENNFLVTINISDIGGTKMRHSISSLGKLLLPAITSEDATS